MSQGNWREFDDLVTRVIPLAKTPKECREVRVQRTKGGKRGKIVTVISGLELNKIESKNLLKSLKTSCGTGGTVKEDSLELQGDQVSLILDLLKKEGFCPKRSGG